MSVMQKIFGAFTPGTPPAPAPAAPQVTNNPANNPAPPAPHSSAGTQANGVVPPDGSKGPEGEPPSPIEKFSKVWEPTPTDPNKQSPEDSLTPEKMLEAAGKVDFTRVLDQESLKKITAGGEEAVAALAGLLNKTAQTVYGQSMVVTKKLLDVELKNAEDRFAAKVPGMVRNQSVREGLSTENPAFSHPAVAPFVDALQGQLAQKHPNATAPELQALAKEYFMAASQVFNPTPKSSTAAGGKDSVDWDSWVSN